MLKWRGLPLLGIILALSVAVPILLVQLSQAESDPPAPAQVVAGSAVILPGSVADIPITAFNIPGPGVAGFTLTIAADDSVIQVLDVLSGDAPFGGLLISTITTGAGAVEVRIVDLHAQAGSVGDVLLARLRVEAANTQGITDLSLTVDQFIDPNSNDIPVQAVDGQVIVTGTSIVVGSATIIPSTTADIPITALGVPSPGASGFTLNINFDSSIMELIDVLPGDAPFGGLLTVNSADGTVVISDAHGAAAGVIGDHLLARLRVRAIGAAGGTDLSLTIVSFKDANAGNILAIAVDGRLELDVDTQTDDPVLVTPPQNAVIGTQRPQFTWTHQDESGPVTYNVRVASGDFATGTVVRNINTQALTFTPSVDLPVNPTTKIQAYEWSVQATDALNNTSNVVFRSFTINLNAPVIV